MKNPKTILITGASSGVGKALALEYASSGVTLLLTGRDKKRLNETAAKCQERGAKTVTKILDIRKGQEVKKWILERGAENNIDLVFANAGISAGTEGGAESEEQVKKIFDVNVNGVINTIHPALEIMTAKKQGQIAIISSLAGFRGLPSSPAYSASKAAVRVYGEGLRGSLGKLGIKVNVVCPGYIKTPMTDVNEFYMPFLMDSKRAAKIIIRGLEKNKSRIAFPFPLYFVVWLVTLMSNKIIDPIFARLPAKKSLDDV